MAGPSLAPMRPIRPMLLAPDPGRPAALSAARGRAQRLRAAAGRQPRGHRGSQYLHFVHLVATARPTLAADERARCSTSCSTTGAAPAPSRPPAERTTLLVVPRLGTISPWSSKATDIARICGLAAVRAHRARHRLPDRRARCAIAAALRARAARPHDRDACWPRAEDAAAAVRARAPPRPLAHRRPGRRRARARWTRPTARWAWRWRPTRSTTWSRPSPTLGRDPDRRRADDVRAGQQRALPAQDLQRRVRDRRRAARRSSLFQMIRRSTEASPDGRAVGLQGQRRGHRGLARRRASSPTRASGALRARSASRCTS